jgi:hypothetical protein
MENGTVSSELELATGLLWRQVNQRFDRLLYEKIELERRVEELQCENGSLRRRVAELESE